MGIDSKDIDFTFVLDDLDQSVEAGFQQMTEFLQKEGFQIFLSTPECFTIRAKFPKDHKNTGLVADFVMARKEIGYIPGTRRPILALGTLHDDLVRRDFTVNAIAEDIDGNIIDPFDGVKHISERILYTPLPAETTFMDDPLRILRALRFTITKGFLMDKSLLDAMKQPGILDKLRTTVSTERIREEVYKMMAKDTAESIRLLYCIDEEIPGFFEIIFDKGLWLKPTMESK